MIYENLDNYDFSNLNKVEADIKSFYVNEDYETSYILSKYLLADPRCRNSFTVKQYCAFSKCNSIKEINDLVEVIDLFLDLLKFSKDKTLENYKTYLSLVFDIYTKIATSVFGFCNNIDDEEISYLDEEMYSLHDFKIFVPNNKEVDGFKEAYIKEYKKYLQTLFKNVNDSATLKFYQNALDNLYFVKVNNKLDINVLGKSKKEYLLEGPDYLKELIVYTKKFIDICDKSGINCNKNIYFEKIKEIYMLLTSSSK